MGFYMISDWVPAYGYGLTSKDNSDIYPSNDAEDIYGGIPIIQPTANIISPKLLIGNLMISTPMMNTI